MTDKPSELKPCPFCGGAASTQTQHQQMWVMCGSGCCGWMTPEHWHNRVIDRAALVEVARRAAACGSGGDDYPTAIAQRIVTEYLAEQARKDAK